MANIETIIVSTFKHDFFFKHDIFGHKPITKFVSISKGKVKYFSFKMWTFPISSLQSSSSKEGKYGLKMAYTT